MAKKYLKAGRTGQLQMNILWVNSPPGMMKHTILLFFLCTLCPCFVKAQTNNDQYKDSLLRIAELNKRDTNTLKAIGYLYRAYFNEGNFNMSLHYCQKALLLAQQLGLPEKQARITYSIGLNYTNLIQYDSARFYLDQCLKLPGAQKDTILLVQCYNTNAMLCNYQSDFSMAITHLMKSVELLEAAQAPEIKVLMAQTYMNLCNNLLEEKQLNKALEYGLKGLTYSNYPDEKRYRTLIHLDLADIYMKFNKAAQAGHHLDSAIQYNQSLNNPATACLVANTRGAYYVYIHDHQGALKAYQEAYQLSDSTGYDLMKASVAVNIASLYFKLNNYAEAERFAMTGNELALKNKRYNVAADAFQVMQNIAAQKGDYKKALEYATFNKQYADSATNSATQKVTLSLESKYQHQKREKEIAELRAIATEKELTIVKRNRLLIIGSFTAILLLLAVSLLYRTSKQKQTIAGKEQKLQQEQIKFLEGQQQVLSLQSMLNGQETERTRIARDLHDGLGGLFSTVKMNFSALQHEHGLLKNDPLFQKSYDLVDTASSELRRIAHNMMPEVLMKLGLIQAIQDMCAAISAGKLLQVTMQAYGMHQRLNGATEIMLYRIIQELINNIIKHAYASEAIIQFNKDGNRLTVTVEDNGRGFNMQEVDTAKHTGIETIKSRVHYLNGNFNIDSQNGIGTTIMMEFLVNENA